MGYLALGVLARWTCARGMVPLAEQLWELMEPCMFLCERATRKAAHARLRRP